MPAFGVADRLTGTGVAAAWNARHCNVISPMRYWYQFEPTAGTYSFGNLKTAGDGIDFAHTHDIGLQIRFMAGADSPVGRPGVSTATHPDWLAQAPYSVPRFRTLDNDSGTPDREFWMPLVTNATYIARYLLAVDAWDAWFESACPGGGTAHKVAAHIVGFTVSAVTENGSEQVVSPGQRHRYTGGTTPWPVGYGADYNDPQNLSPGSMSASGTVTGIPSTAAFTVPGLFKISDANSTAYGATDELVYATGKTATTLTTSGGGARGVSGTTAQTHAGGTAEIQKVTLGSFAAGDSFTLTAEGNTTPSFVNGTNATAAAIQAALRTATGNNTLTVGGTANTGPFTVTWAGESGDQPTMTGVGTGCTVTITTQTTGTVGQVIRQADQSNTTAVHLATFNGVTSLVDHSRLNAQQWFNADGLTYNQRQTALGAGWRQNLIDCTTHLTTVRASWAAGQLWGDSLDNANAQLEELGASPTYRPRLIGITTNLQAKPPRTLQSQPVPTYAASLSSYFDWLKRAQTLGLDIAIQTGSTGTTGAGNGQEIIDACDTGWEEFGQVLEFIEMNAAARFNQDNGGAGYDTWEAYGWHGGLRCNGTADAGPFDVRWSVDGDQPTISGTGTGCTVSVATTKAGVAGSAGVVGTAEVQRITLTGFGAGDSFTLTWNGVTSSAFVFGTNARANDIASFMRTQTGDTGHIADMEDYFVSYDGSFPQALQARIAEAFEVTSTRGATLTGTGSATIVGRSTRKAAATLTGTGASAVSSKVTRLGRGTLTGTGTVVGTGIITGTGGTGWGQTAWGLGQYGGAGGTSGAATLTGTGSATITGVRTRMTGATLTGVGSQTAAGTHLGLGAATITGRGSLVATWAATEKQGAATLTGTGASSITGRRERMAAATLTGTGSATVAGTLGRTGEATLTGTGSASVGRVLTRLGRANLTGTGSLTAQPAIVILTSGAILTGHGTLTARVPVEGSAILVGISSQRAEGHIVSAYWLQSFTDEWEDALV